MNIKTYKRVTSVEEGYQVLNARKNNTVIGGCTFLKQSNKKIGTAIDLTDCGLEYIHGTEESVRIGAYTSLRDIEVSTIVKEAFGQVFNEILDHFIGVQLRNQVTIGGHVYGRFGFSDLIPLLLALNAEVLLHHHGRMTLESFTASGVKKDILIEVIIPKVKGRTKVQMMRNSFNDYSLFCLVISKTVSNDWRIVAGARPGRAKLAYEAMAMLADGVTSKEDIEAVVNKISEEIVFGSNFRASADYRKSLCQVFARRALEELCDGH